MTKANALTLLRILLVPVFLVILYIGFPGSDWAALAVFIVASLTDLLDGWTARHFHEVSNLGKFMDPLADKVQVCTAMCWLIQRGSMAGWVLAAVLLREFAVSGLRLVAVERGRVIAAAWSGKVKTASTMVCLCLMLVFHLPWMDLLCQAIILCTTLYSGAEYFWKNIHVFRER